MGTGSTGLGMFSLGGNMRRRRRGGMSFRRRGRAGRRPARGFRRGRSGRRVRGTVIGRRY